MKRGTPPAHHFSRGLILLASFGICAIGIYILTCGTYAALDPSWLRGVYADGATRADGIAWASVSTGAVVASCAIAGCMGAILKRNLYLRAFGLIVILSLLALGAAVTVMWTTDSALEAAQNANYNAGDMRGEHSYTWRNIYVEFAALYRYCSPANASSVGASLAVGRIPAGDLNVVCNERLLRKFGEWTSDNCVHDVGSWGRQQLDMVQHCRIGLNLSATPLHDDASWLFCACAPRLSENLRSWLTPVRIFSICVTVYMLVLLLALCSLCKGISKAHKKAKLAALDSQLGGGRVGTAHMRAARDDEPSMQNEAASFLPTGREPPEAVMEEEMMESR